MSVQMNELENDKLSEIVGELSGLHGLATQLAEAGNSYDRFTLRQLDDHIINLHQISLDISHYGLQAVCGKLRENIHHHLLAGTYLSQQEIVLITEWKSLVKAYVSNSNNDKVIEALMDNLSKQNWPEPLETDARKVMDKVLHSPFIQPEENVADAETDSSVELDESSNPLEVESVNGVTEEVVHDSVKDALELPASDDVSSPVTREIDLLDDLEEYDANLDAIFEANEDESGDAGVDLSITIETSYKDVSNLMSDDALIDQLYEDNDELEEHSLSSYFAADDVGAEENKLDSTSKYVDPVENAMTQLFEPIAEKQEADNLSDEDVSSIEQAESKLSAIEDDLFTPSDDEDVIESKSADSSADSEEKLDTSATKSESVETSLDKSNEILRALFKSSSDNDETDEMSSVQSPEEDLLHDEAIDTFSIEDELFAPSDEASEESETSDNYEEEFNQDFDRAAEETQHELKQIRFIGLNDTDQEISSESVQQSLENDLFAPADGDLSDDTSSSENYEQEFEQDISAIDVKNDTPQAIADPGDEAESEEVQVSDDDDIKSPASDIQELEEELIEKNIADKDDLGDISEPIENTPINESAWSTEQKELLSLIVAEVQDAIAQQEQVVEVFDAQPVDEGSVRDVLTLYAEQVERMGSAADMVGLAALQKISELLQTHFSQLGNAGIDQIVLAKEKIMQWPHVVLQYLSNIYSSDGQQRIVNYIADPHWITPVSENVKKTLLSDFVNSTIKVESAEEDNRIKVASEDDVNIAVSDDVQVELLDGMLQELPHQAEEFSAAVQKLVEDDYLEQLEITQRIAHTIKGAANTVGIKGVAALTHNLEDILQALLKAQAKPNPQLLDALVEAADCLEQMTECLLGTGDEPKDAVATLQAILDWANYIDEFGPPEDAIPDSQTHEVVKPSVKTIGVTLAKAKQKTKVSAESSLRVPANIIDELLKQSGESIISASQMQEQVDHALAQLRDMKINKDSVLSLSQQLEHLIDVQGIAGKQLSKAQDEKFDPLEMDQYNELHTFSRRLMEASADSVELVKQLENRILQLESSVASQLRAQKEYQHAVLTTRMVPVDSIVPRLKRGVRQAAKISGKSVNLHVVGNETLVDSKILNNLIDPLMHLLRNSVDHGIESAEVRTADRKEVTGRIELSFVQDGDRIVVTCLDDGKGLDANLIRAKAVEKQLISDDDDLSDEEIYQLIMRHGLSTRTEVTQLSGRGVGMDVVYSSIKELNGSIIVSSQANMGTTIELAFPVSLLSVHALLVKVNTRTIAVSTHGIEEILQAQASDLVEEAGELFLKVEEDAYPAIHIEELLGVSAKKDLSSQNYTAFLVHEFGEQQKVILVDRVISTNDIVIKPFSRYLPKILGIIGATVLGNGEIATVVDVMDLISQEEDAVHGDDHRLLEEASNIPRVVALIVEDSISTRKSLAEFMQDLNYEVYTAKDGVEAIEVMRKNRPNIVLTDLEMPRMNGLELTSHMRSNEETKHIPVIMITSRTTEKHKQEAEAIGVSEYLSKPYQEDLLIEKVQQLAPIT